MSLQNKVLEFWFEFGSTYTYLTVARIGKLAESRGVSVEWKPFFLPAIMKKVGMDEGPFLPNPAKLEYMWRDVERRANRFNIVYVKPAVYPVDSLLTCRIGYIASKEGWCESFTRAVFNLHWQKGIHIGTDENLSLALGSLGKDYRELVVSANEPRNKEALKVQTWQAWEMGIFGSPSFLVNEELFWGDDRLEEALDWLNK